MTNIHLKTAWDHIRRVPFQALSAVFVLAITFFVITIISVAGYSSSQLLKYFETRPQIIAFLKDDVDQSSVTTLDSKLKNDERVASTNYVSKEDALEIYKQATSDNPLLSELVSPSIFPASLEVSLSDLSHAQSLIDELKSEEIIDQVGFTASLGGEDSLNDVVNRLRSISWYIKVGGSVFATLLILTSFLVLIVIIGMRITTRRGEIEILNLIGATKGFIRSPIILEGMIYSFTGVLVGWITSILVVLYSTPSLINYFGDIPVLPKETTQLFVLFGIILAVELVVGFILALTGSMLAVSRVKKS